MDYQGTSGNDTIDQAALNLPDWTTILTNGGDDNILLTKGVAYINAPGNNIIRGTSILSAVSYWNAPAPIFANLESGIIKNGFGGTDRIFGIHSIHVSNNSTISGSSSKDMYFILGQNNFVDGKGGNDTVVIYGKRSTDYNILYNAAENALLINNKISGATENKVKNIEAIEFSGPNSDNTTVSVWELQNSVVNGFSATNIHSNFSAARKDLVADSLIPGDFNGDGNIDLAVFRLNFTTTPSAPIQILLGDGHGAFQDGTSQIFRGDIPITSYAARALVRDINNDGIDDIYAIDSGMDVPPWTGGQNALYLSDGKGFLKNSTSLLPQIRINSHGAAIGDINQDGLLDILDNTLTPNTSDTYSGNILKIQNRQGNFGLANNLFPNELIPNIYGSGSMIKTSTWSALIDVNKDSYPDALLGTWTGNSKPSEVYINNGGSFANSKPIALPRIGLYKETVLQISPIDLNGDELPDLIVSATDGGDSTTESDRFYTVPYLQLLINKGGGSFVDETDQRLPQTKINNTNDHRWYKYVFATDINRDGYSDIAAVGSDSIGVTIFQNDGTGKFEEIFSAPSLYSYGAVTDIDNDGLDDIIMSNRDASNVTFWLNKNPNKHIYKANFGGDKLSGSSQNDVFLNGDGSDYFNGRQGVDLVSYKGALIQYSISINSDNTVISSKNSGNGEVDRLLNIERLHFSDKVIATDIQGNAGQAYRLYQAALDRTPDERGLAGWIKFMDDGGSLTAMSQQFIDSQEFKTKYGALDNSKFVNQLYLNVLERNGEPSGIAGWVNGMANGLSRAEVLKGFSESAENQANVIGQIKNGIPYVEWWLA